jgi:hypothetical protein
LAALNWSILNMVVSLEVVGLWGGSFVALHNDHFRASSPQVKGFLLHCNKEERGTRHEAREGDESST